MPTTPTAPSPKLDRGIAQAPDLAKLHTLRGLLHQKRGRFPEAWDGLKRAIELDPADATAYLNLGNLLLKTERYVPALLFLEHAARLKPDLVEAYAQLAEAHRQLGHQSVVITLLEHAYSLAPERIDIRWMACWARMHGCAWGDYAGRIGDLLASAVAAGHTISPFMIMAFGLSDTETLLWTRAWAEHNMPTPPARSAPARDVPRAPDGRLRIGYLSADFRGHATAALVSELFRLQDRTRFELFGYNIGRSDGSDLGQHMTSALDAVVDVAALDDREAAGRIAEDGIAIPGRPQGFHHRQPARHPGLPAGAAPGQLPRLPRIDGHHARRLYRGGCRGGAVRHAAPSSTRRSSIYRTAISRTTGVAPAPTPARRASSTDCRRPASSSAASTTTTN